MRQWRPLIGRLLFLLAAFVACYLGATMGGLGTREVRASHTFGDVPDSAFFHDFVQFLVDTGITAGCGPGLFCGEDPVTRGQMAVFLKKLSDVVPVCPPDSVKVGTTCMDRYEASVWEVPAGNTALIQKIKAGTVTKAELQAGALQRGATSNDYGAACPEEGNGCVNLYAASVAAVTPSRFLTWFQATAAARNAGKRLPTNAEWQAAALGTPDPGDAPGGQDCNTQGTGPSPTGSRANCRSDVVAFDMVGNVTEWVADWMLPATACSVPLFGTGDNNCMTINPQAIGTVIGPSMLVRGGAFDAGNGAGVFSVFGNGLASEGFGVIGFRAAR